ncbi:Calcium-dependent phosphotriesterase superfamily protein [Euphorbia peplus]|nr:Calcium-dependent phosphotriesterase superfamily protein [Euphorbia peplus]
MLTKRKSPLVIIFFLLLTPVLASARLVYRFNVSNSDNLFDNDEELMNNGGRREPEILGKGKLKGPEDIIYDEKSRVIYTGCRDGWIKRVKLSDSVDNTVVEKWVNTGGRPLGLSWLPGKEDIVVADANKGLLKIEGNGKMEVLTQSANGIKFKLTDGVNVAKDGKIYFTDASSKFDIKGFMFDIISGNPNGRLLSYDPNTSQTQLLASGLYFANGVALSPNQDFLVFCETPKRRCKKYNIKGKRKGRVEHFVKLPGMPDNIHFQDGYFWIAASTLPEAVAKMGKKKGEKGRVYKVNLDGKVCKKYGGGALKYVSSAVKIDNYLYCGSLVNSHIVRLSLS